MAKIPLHNLFEEAWGISKIKDIKELEKLAEIIRKEGLSYEKENLEEVKEELEARRFDESESKG